MSEPYLQRAFRLFSRICGERSPLYAEITARVAEDRQLWPLLPGGRKQQLAGNLLMGAVHYLLLGGTRHPLADCYPSVGGTRPAGEAYPLFLGFCREHGQAIQRLVHARAVQTNDAGRCGALMPAFARACEQGGGRPLWLVEVGAAAGLNLLFDRYAYDYGDGVVLGSASAPRVHTELRGELPCPLPRRLPPVAGRVGLDRAPVDVRDAQDMRWLQALIWPEPVHRHVLFRAALALARSDPPAIEAGDGIEGVGALVARAPSGALPCVFHSFVTYQMDSAWRGRFEQRLAQLGAERDLAHVSLEWLGEAPGPELHLTLYRSGQRHTEHLADAHHHGAWLRWLAR